MNELILIPVLSALAGFIDSIAGGGGLITIPMWTFILGPGAHVVATNKIGGTITALTALLVYRHHGKLPWREAVVFLIPLMMGSVTGAHFSSLVPADFFRWILIIICPIILWVVWSKEKLLAERPLKEIVSWHFALAGFCVGLYEGFFGPGGGTFMLLALLWFTPLPLMSALALSKLANTLASGVSLVSYASMGLVNWRYGAISAACMVGAAFLGARLATRKSVHIVRPILTVVVVLLLIKIIVDLW